MTRCLRRKEAAAPSAGKPPTAVERLHVDHDHACCSKRKMSCGKCVRGLLCSQCNHLLGDADDDTERLLSAIDYLEQHRAISDVVTQQPVAVGAA